MKSLALENGFAETGSGVYERRGPDGTTAMRLRPLDGEPRRDAGYVTGLTFALDVPLVADPMGVLDDMGRVAEAFGVALGGELVDDEQSRLPGESAIEIEFLEHDTAMVHLPGAQALEALEEGCGLDSTVGLHPTDDHVHVFFSFCASALEHGVGLPDAR